jgi:NADH dehydrogenase FAD-containing subunit
MLKKVGQDMSPRARKMILGKLIGGGVEILTESKAISFEENTVIFDRAGLTNRLEADSIVLAVGTAPVNIKIPGLKKSGLIRYIGDANGPRTLFAAMHEGYRAGMEA